LRPRGNAAARGKRERESAKTRPPWPENSPNCH